MTAVALLLAHVGPATGPGSSLLSRGVDVLHAVGSIRRILVALPPGHRAPDGTVAVPLGRDLPSALEDVIRDPGRATSVVLHDPCRIPVDVGVFGRALDEFRRHRCDAVVAAAPATDTLKRVDGDDGIVETVDRNGMWELRTPQVYRVGALRAALDCAGRALLTEAILAGDHGLLPSLVQGPVRIVPMPRESMRVERPGDAQVVERLLRAPG